MGLMDAYPRTPRLINRFSLGADPEFVFSTITGAYAYAENLGLTTSRAFGCDMAGRQAEIRAYPSKFALEVVASVVDSLRWMAYVTRNETGQLIWSATSFNGKDGCGGHIHLGRRRADRKNDQDILDATLISLLNLGVFDKKKFEERKRNTHYGQYGDIRPQSYGFEYRTPPTQMASPWLMYFTLVLNKLLVYHGAKFSSEWLDSLEKVTNLFIKYQYRDDDAAIALKALQRWGLPKENVSDFRFRWGVSNWAAGSELVEEGKENFYPSVIKPEEYTCQELFEHLTRGKAMIPRTPQPTWEPFVLPKGFYNLQAQRHTLGHLPDTVKDLISKNQKVQISIGEEFEIYHDISLPAQEIRQALSSCSIPISFHLIKSGGIQINIPVGFNKNLVSCKTLHEVLGNTDLFPVCKAENYKAVDWSRWDNPVVTSSKLVIGKLRGQVMGKPPEPKVPVARNRGSYSYEVYYKKGV